MTQLILAILVMLGMAEVAVADGLTSTVGPTTRAIRTRTVFNDAGATLVSGEIVVWDNDDTEYDRTGYPYVTRTTSGSSIYVAGLVYNDTCPDQTMCEIVVEGPWFGVYTAANLVEDTLVSTSTTAALIGDYAPAANTCSVGTLLENIDPNTTLTCSAGAVTAIRCKVPIEVNITCQ